MGQTGWVNESIISLMAGGVKKEVVGCDEIRVFWPMGPFPHFEGYLQEEISW